MTSFAATWINSSTCDNPLALLVNRIPWQEIEVSLAHRFAQQMCRANRLKIWVCLARQFQSLAQAFPTQADPFTHPIDDLTSEPQARLQRKR
jgi:hypothetical protein